jgi:hypothetical protein
VIDHFLERRRAVVVKVRRRAKRGNTVGFVPARDAPSGGSRRA